MRKLSFIVGKRIEMLKLSICAEYFELQLSKKHVHNQF